MKEVKLPRRFFIDHMERDLPTPTILRETKSHIFSALDDPHLPELMRDADYYRYARYFDREYFGLCASARATFNALRAAGISPKGHDAE